MHLMLPGGWGSQKPPFGAGRNLELSPWSQVTVPLQETARPCCLLQDSPTLVELVWAILSPAISRDGSQSPSLSP